MCYGLKNQYADCLCTKWQCDIRVQLPGNPYGDFNSCTRVEDCRVEGKMCHGLKNQYADCLCKKGQCDIKVQLPGYPYGDFNSCKRVEDCREKGKMCHGLKNEYADCLCTKGQCDIKVQLSGNPYGDFNSCTRVEDCRKKGKMCHGLKNQYADCLCKKGQCDIKGKVWPSSPSNNINNPAPSPKNLHGYGGYWPSGLLKPDTHIKPFGFHSANYLSGLNSLQKHTDKKKFALDERTVVNDMPNPYGPWK